MYIQRICLVAIILACAPVHAEQNQSDFSFPPPLENGAKPHKLWATHYFVHVAHTVSSGVAFRDKAGKVVSDKVSPRDWCLAAIEGTVQVTMDGQPRTLNYGGVGTKSLVDCAAILKIDPAKKPWISGTGRSYFTSALGIYGDGVKGYRLIPFRTVAVDSKTFPYGTVIFIQRAKGTEITLPSGEVAKHDGYFFAGDTGGAIKGKHIDVFCGITDKNCFPDFITSDEKAPFDAIEVTDSVVIESLKATHRK